MPSKQSYTLPEGFIRNRDRVTIVAPIGVAASLCYVLTARTRRGDCFVKLSQHGCCESFQLSLMM